MTFPSVTEAAAKQVPAYIPSLHLSVETRKTFCLFIYRFFLGGEDLSLLEIYRLIFFLIRVTAITASNGFEEKN